VKRGGGGYQNCITAVNRPGRLPATVKQVERGRSLGLELTGVPRTHADSMIAKKDQELRAERAVARAKEAGVAVGARVTLANSSAEGVVLRIDFRQAACHIAWDAETDQKKPRPWIGIWRVRAVDKSKK